MLAWDQLGGAGCESISGVNGYELMGVGERACMCRGRGIFT